MAQFIKKRAEFASADAAKSYALAGNAKLTLVSQATETELVFKITRWDRGGYVVRLVEGDGLSYVGHIGTAGFRLTGASGFQLTDEPVRAFAYFWNGILAGRIAPQLTVYHEGRCGACGRALKASDSVEIGIGSSCLKTYKPLRCA